MHTDQSYDHFQDGILGCLLGVHVGDSLGAPLEFGGGRPRGEWLREMEALGAFPPGTPTDDTDLMICVLRSLKGRKGLDLFKLAHEMIEWHAQGPADIGLTTLRAIVKMKRGVPLDECGEKGELDQGNGSLMRCAPLALLDVGSEELRQIVYAQAALTHAHPRCQLADHLLCSAIKLAFAGVQKDEIFDRTIRAAQKWDTLIPERLSRIASLAWDELPTSGFVLDTLAAAFWGLMRTETFEDALVHVVNRGNDADTVGAVTGALCGAYYGKAAIPSRWLSVIRRRAEIESLVGEVLAGDV